VSQSPDDASGAAEAYRQGWSALTTFMRRGFSWSGHERNCAFLNTGDSRFEDVSFVSGLDHEEDSRAAASIDWDLDGDLDLVLAGRGSPRVRILSNESPRGASFVAFRLRGTEGNTGGVGALVEVELTGEPARKLVRGRRAGEGYLAQGSHWVHFGLDGRDVQSVHVRWPGGASEEFQGAKAGDRFELVQGTGVARAWERPAGEPELVASTPEAPAATLEARIVLQAPVPLPSLEIEAVSGEMVRLFGITPTGPTGTGAPVLLNLWATWCKPCAEELRGLAARAADIAREGLTVVALSVDDPQEKDAAKLYLEDLAWPHASGQLPARTAAVIETLWNSVQNREADLPVPTSLLVDTIGRVVAIYVGPLDVDRVLADLPLVGAEANARRARAVPFAGRWFAAPGEVDLASFERAYRRRGLDAAASELHLGQVEVQAFSQATFHYNGAVARARQGRPEEAEAGFRKALEVNPYYFEAYRELARLLKDRGAPGEAVSPYRSALRLRPDDAEVQSELGLALLASGDRDAAEACLAWLREHAPQSARPLAAALAADRDR